MKNALKYGSISGLVMTSSWWLGQLIFSKGDGEPFDFSQGEILGYLAMLLGLSAVFVGVKQHRDKEMDGKISFGGAFMVGLNIVLVSSAIYVIGWMIYYPIYMPDFYQQYYESQLVTYEQSGLSAEELAAKKQEIEEWVAMYENPFVMAGMTFMEIFPVGLVIAVIAAAVLKKR